MLSTSEATTGRRSGPRPLDRVYAGVSNHPGPAVCVLYVLVAVAVEWDVVTHIASACACNAGTPYPHQFSVPTAFMWALKWWPHAVTHFQNPFMSYDIWTPQGLDLARATSVPAAALAASPLTALFGPLVAFNILIIVGPVTGAWAAYRLCLHVSRSQLASALGGYLYGFSSYELAHILGLLHTTFTFAAPVCALLALKRLDDRISVRRLVTFLAVTLIVQLLLSTEIFLSLTMMAAATFVLGWLFAPVYRNRLAKLVLPVSVAYGVAIVLCLVYLYYALARGSGYSAGASFTYSADVLNFAIPTHITWLGGHLFSSVSTDFVGELGEQGSYLGLPLILILFAFFVQARRTAAAKILLCLIVIAAVWSLGPKLHLDGHMSVDLPALVLAKLPVFDQLIPARIAVYVALAASVVVALWLSSAGARAWRWALAALAVLSLIPNVNATYPGTRVALFHSRVSEPRFFSTKMYRGFLSRNEVVLPLPWGNQGTSMLWQAQTGMYFRMASGHFGSPPPGYSELPIVNQLLANAPGPQAARELRSLIVSRGVGAVIQTSGRARRWTPVLIRLGLKPVRAGGVRVYRVPPSWTGDGF